MAKEKEEVYIDLQTFADRISVNIQRAREMSRSKLFQDQRISVNTNPDGKRGGTRIHWGRYQQFLDGNPVVPDHKRVRDKLRVV